MAKRGNSAGSTTIRITISTQSADLLEQLAAQGVYGRNVSEVAARFVDEALRRFLQLPQLTIKLSGSSGAR